MPMFANPSLLDGRGVSTPSTLEEQGAANSPVALSTALTGTAIALKSRLGRLPDGPGRTARDQGPPRSFLLQPWITIRATSPVTSVTQEDSGWHDLCAFADAVFWVELGEISPPAGGSIALSIESSPTWDEVNFRPVAPPLTLARASGPSGAVVPQLIRCVRTPSTVALSRWTRWKLQAVGGTGAWAATIRIRGTAGSSIFVQPTSIADCVLWLRADLGVTLDASGKLSSWDDQSAAANRVVGSVWPPSYNTRQINGQATICFDPSQGQHLHFDPSLPSSYTAVHAFVVHRRLTASEASAANTGFWRLNGDGVAIPATDGHLYDDCASTTTAPPYDCGTPVIALTTPHVYEVASQASSWVSRLNGILQFSTATNTVAGFDLNADIGGNATAQRYYRGDWAEVVMYSRVLATAERALLIDYFNGRYGLGAA